MSQRQDDSLEERGEANTPLSDTSSERSPCETDEEFDSSPAQNGEGGGPPELSDRGESPGGPDSAEPTEGSVYDVPESPDSSSEEPEFSSENGDAPGDIPPENDEGLPDWVATARADYFSGRRKLRFVRIAIVLVLGVVSTAALMIGNPASRCSGNPEQPVAPAVEENRSRTGEAYIMFSSSLAQMRDVQSFSYMYLSGPMWSTGDVVKPDRSNQRYIDSHYAGAPEYEVRSIATSSWWRVRGGRGWQTDGLDSTVRRSLDPWELAAKLDSIANDVDYIRLVRQGSVRDAYDQSVAAYKLNGTIGVQAMRDIGLRTVGQPDGSRRTQFDFWIEVETGLPVKVVFHGVPPAGDPLGVLYLFEHNALLAENIVPPPPEALVSREVVEDQPAVEPNGLVEPETPEPSVVMSETDDAVVSSTEPQTTGLDRTKTTDPYVETVASETDGWRRYVLPTEGFAIEMPDTWVASVLPMVGQHGLYGISADGVWSCSILRLPEPAALFAVAQRAVEQVLLEESLVEENVGFLSESLPSGNAIRIDYTVIDGAGSLRSIHMYLIGRAPLGEVGLGYQVTCEGPASAGSGLGAFTLLMVVRSFELLGAEPNR